MSIRVLLADDHSLIRAGVARLLASLPGIEVVGEVGDGQAALDMVAQLMPDLVILDVNMPGLSGLPTARRLQSDFPKVRVMILSMHRDDAYVRQALEFGAAAYVLKDAAPTELESAIQAVMRGDTWLSPAVTRRLVDDYTQRLRSDGSSGSPLTPRQLEVLTLIARGKSSKEIARELDVSLKTVDTHRTQLMRALDLHDVAGLVRYAIRRGLVSPDGD